jgi:predicted component of type VI protein secretion system
MIVHIGPVTLDVYKTFLPQMLAYHQLVDLIHFLTTPEIDIWINIELMGKEVPGSILGERAQLGQLSALKSQSCEVVNNLVANFKVQ